MLHQARRWKLQAVTAQELLRLLSEQTQTLCTGFRVSGTPYLFLNDSTSENAAQEYALVKCENGRLWQVESLTVSWCQPFKLAEYIRRALAGEYDESFNFGEIPAEQLETPEAHGRCIHCA